MKERFSFSTGRSSVNRFLVLQVSSASLFRACQTTRALALGDGPLLFFTFCNLKTFNFSSDGLFTSF